jgi:DNA-binding beta-propeller fold protein YncE
MSVSIDYTGGVFQANRAKSVGTVTAGTGPYNLASASYDSVSLDVSSTTGTFLSSMRIGDSDTKIYVCSNSNDRIYQWNLSTASDLSSASLHGSFATGTQTTNPTSVFFKTDGTKMYVSDGSLEDIYQYALSTAWDVTTASYESKVFSPSELNTGQGIFFSTDGTKFYYENYSTETTYQYTLSTAWDISTASYDSKSFTSTEANDIYDIFITPDGYKLYKVSLLSDAIYQYSLSTAWDISTASYDSISFSVASQATSPIGFSFNSDGTKMIVSDTGTDALYQYSTVSATTLDLSTGNYFSHTPSVNTLFAFSNAPASGTAAGFALALTGGNAAEAYDLANASYDSVSFSVAGQALLPTSFYISPDGLSLYVLDDGTNTAYQYSLSTAWDISSASYASKSFSAFSETTLTGIYFSSDGTKLYVTGFVSDAVSEYNLSTPWDISTASLSQSFSIFSQTSLPTGVFFSADGTKMFVSDTSADSIFKYVLSSAWDVSTASFSQSLSVTSEETNPQDIFFSPTGTKMFITGQNGVVIDEYSLSTAWDLSTATYSTSFSTSSQEPNLRGAFFKVDGSKMYVVGVDNDTIYQYTTGSTATATFTYPSSVKFPSGTAPAGPAIGETDVLVFYTDDGGTTYQGFRAGDAMA